MLGLSLPPYTEARLASTDLTEILPAECRTDLVVVLLAQDAPVRVVVVDVQLAVDPRKRISWPACVTVARAIHGCPAALLVIAPEPAVADWCAEPIKTGVPGFVLRPSVLRRADIPVVTDPREAARRPELGVLSAMAHGETEKGAMIAAAVLLALQRLVDCRDRLYSGLEHHSLNDATHQELEKVSKGYYAAKGRAEGRTEQAGRSLLTVLRVRGITVPDAVRERILAQKDPERLRRWLEKAIVAASVQAVFDEPN